MLFPRRVQTWPSRSKYTEAEEGADAQYEREEDLNGGFACRGRAEKVFVSRGMIVHSVEIHDRFEGGG